MKKTLVNVLILSIASTLIGGVLADLTTLDILAFVMIFNGLCFAAASPLIAELLED